MGHLKLNFINKSTNSNEKTCQVTVFDQQSQVLIALNLNLQLNLVIDRFKYHSTCFVIIIYQLHVF